MTHLGIEVNPDQIVALQSLKSPQSLKEVQQLTGMTAALNQFILRSTDGCQPFFQLLKKRKGFQWTDECQQTFEELKLYLAQAPILSRLVPKETLYMYLAVNNHAVSVVLLRLD